MSRLLLLAVCLMGTAGVAGAADADADTVSLRLRPQTTVYGEAVTLGDVLVFASAADELTERIAGEPVCADAARPLTAVSHDTIVRRLDELGVNLSRVLVGGALQCVITRPPPAQPLEPESVAAPLLGAPAAPVAEGGRALAEVLRAHVNGELASLGGTAEIDFERAGQEFLQLTTPPWDFGVSSSSRDKLGLREFHVVIRRDGHVQRKVDLYAQVRLVRPVVVARRPLNPGNFIRSDDVAVETRVFADAAHRGPSQIEEVVGQQIKRFVPAGEAVRADAIKPADLVVRSRPVTVTNDNSAVHVRLTGMALDSGGYGDTVRIRMGDTRGERQLLRGVVTGLGTVRLVEGNL
ncbi:MAG: flagellar basal body P-ring formation protein FlgA [Phycisphaerae bacterium]|nr:flagellar basal body P-ring formation protein FlgA [Phycisphaerae bacterium]